MISDDSENDVYHIPAHLQKTVRSDDKIVVNLNYATFGNDVIGGAIAIDLQIEGGENDGAWVRFNPCRDGNLSGRDKNILPITFTLILNPDSPIFKDLDTVSQASEKLTVMVSERGDGVKGFRKENLPMMVTNDGFATIETYHLSSFGLALKDAPQEPEPEPETPSTPTSSGGSDGNCFVSSATQTGSGYVSGILMLIVSFIAVFIGIGICKKYFLSVQK